MGGAHVQRHLRHVVLWYAQEASLQVAGLGRQPGQGGKQQKIHVICVVQLCARKYRRGCTL